jgi:hypothetical protein
MNTLFPKTLLVLPHYIKISFKSPKSLRIETIGMRALDLLTAMVSKRNLEVNSFWGSWAFEALIVYF